MTEPKPRGRPFVKGQSGNPAGRVPKSETFATVLARQLSEVKGGTTTRDRMTAVVVDLALRGNLEAVKWIVERTDGKVPDKIEADVDDRRAPRLDEGTRLAILADAARRRGLARGA